MKRLLLLALMASPAIAMKKGSAEPKADNQTIQEVLKIAIAERDNFESELKWHKDVLREEGDSYDRETLNAVNRKIADLEKDLETRKTQINKLIDKAAK